MGDDGKRALIKSSMIETSSFLKVKQKKLRKTNKNNVSKFVKMKC